MVLSAELALADVNIKASGGFGKCRLSERYQFVSRQQEINDRTVMQEKKIHITGSWFIGSNLLLAAIQLLCYFFFKSEVFPAAVLSRLLFSCEAGLFIR